MSPDDRSPPGASWSREAEADATLEENWLFRLRRERSRSRKSGQSRDFYVLRLADAVSVVAITPDQNVLLVRQFRAGSGRDSLETPGGLVDEGEDPVEAGIRELLEETGYAGDVPWVLGTAWSNPSLLSSRITTLVVRNAKLVAEPRLDEGEEVEVVAVPARRIPAMIRDGKVDHALAVAGLLWWLAADLPDTPLSTLPDDAPPWYQFRIKTLVGLVAISAFVFEILRGLGVRGSLATAAVLVIPASHMVLTRVVDPPRHAVLLARSEPLRRKSVHALATVGMSGLVYAIALILGRALGWL